MDGWMDDEFDWWMKTQIASNTTTPIQASSEHQKHVPFSSLSYFSGFFLGPKHQILKLKMIK